MKVERVWQLPRRWMVHSYYTMNPFAPDGSGRLLASAVDLETNIGEVVIFDADGKLVDHFGRHQVESMFFHTGFWQTWSHDGKFVYYQSGSLAEPSVTRHELATGRDVVAPGCDMEGAPPDGEPIVSGLPGMLYAAGYGYNVYNPAIAPVPFEARDRHGIFEFDFSGAPARLRLSVNDFIDRHPEREKLLALDRELAEKNGTLAGLSLMCYCVRWADDGSRMMIHFGNHCVVSSRGEPRVGYIYTCDRDFSNLRMAVNYGGVGVHWSFHPDRRHLVGYYRKPGSDCQSVWQVGIDGSDLHPIFSARGGGHPSVSPLDPRLGVSDHGADLEFWDIEHDKLIERQVFGNVVPMHKNEATGRNRFRVCHHPVFVNGGRSVLFNVLEEKYSYLAQVAAPELP